jgi:proline iminopeptidase
MKNIDKIKDIKTTIVHGRFDFICTPVQAFQLHSALNNSKLNIMNAGHSGYDPENFKMLKREMKRITS